MIKRITETLKTKRSYLKWGAPRLAEKFNCSERTMRKILSGLKETKLEYLNSI